MTTYRSRDIAPAVREALAEMPVVVLTGLRQAGKSTFLQHQAELQGRRYLSLDDFATLEAARRDPEALVSDEKPLTLDEAQNVPELLAAVKRQVDRNRRPGRFLLSGSANFHLLRNLSESLAGRAVYLTLSPMTRRELKGGIGQDPFLLRFFRQGRPPEESSSSRLTVAEAARGGMPSVCLGEVRDPAVWFRGYEQTYLERDIRSLSQVADLMVFRHLLRLAALRTGQVLNQSELARDAKMNAVTAGRYLSLMEASFVIQRLPPYLANRSSRIIKSPKLYLSDSGIACHLAGLRRTEQLEADPLFGALAETYVAQNLQGILASRWQEARLYFWNVQGRHEVDFVIEDGRETLAIEVKWGSRWTEKDLAGLRAFLERTPRCRGALLAYNGVQTARLGDCLWAIPLGLLLS